MVKLARRWALLTAAYLWRRLLFRTTFIAITGSVGKTTTKDLTAAILASFSPQTISSFGSENTNRETARTLLKVRPWHKFAVLEVATGRPGQIATSARLVAPHIAAILSVARTHTNHFASLEETAQEKATLLRFLRRGGVAILNVDDPRVAAMKPPRHARVIRYGCREDADVRGSDVAGVLPERLSLSVSSNGASAQLQSQLAGTHWTSALLASVAIARECGVPLERIAEAIARIAPTPGRMDPQILPSGAILIRDEHNGSMDTYAVAFEALKNARASRKILAISTVIDTEESWQARMRSLVTEASPVVDLLVLFGEPRFTRRAAEAAERIGKAQVVEFSELRAAAEFFRTELQAGDLVLLRGKVDHHLSRLFHAQFREVGCWKPACSKRILCDHCEELFASSRPR